MKFLLNKTGKVFLFGVTACASCGLFSIINNIHKQIVAEQVKAATTHAKYTPEENYTMDITSIGDGVMPIIGYIGCIDSRSTPEGSYYQPVQTNTVEHYRDAKASGLNIMVGRYESMQKDGGVYAMEALANAEEAGMSYFLHDTDIDKHTSSSEDFNQYLARYTAYDSFAGIYYFDEPNAAMFSMFIEPNRAMKNWAPGYANLVNLLPSYASTGQLSAPSFDDYVRLYCEQTNPDFLSYDHYPQLSTAGNMRSDYFTCMQTVRKYSHTYKIPFWTFNLTTQHGGYRNTTQEDLNWCVNTSLAFGAKGIEYFTYQIPAQWGDGTNFPLSTNQTAFIDKYGNKTPIYYMAQKVNSQIQRMDHILMKSQNKIIIQKNNSFVSTGDACTSNDSWREISSVSTTDDILVGCFDYEGKTVAYFVNNNLNTSRNASFTTNFNTYCEGNLYGPTGNSNFAGNNFSYTLAAGEGVLMEITNYIEEPTDASGATVTGIGSEYVYTGSAIVPNPTVKLDGQTLTKGTDYTVTYSNNTNPGSATLTITFKGNYTGSITKNFTIVKDSVTYTAPTAKTGLIYTGSSQTLINAGSVSKGGTMKYSLDNENWSTSLPVGVEAGEYTVYYYVEGNTGFNSSDVGSLTVSISKQKITGFNAPTAKSPLAYSGSPVSLINAGYVDPEIGTMKYSLDQVNWSTEIPTATDAGEYTIYYKAVANAQTSLVDSDVGSIIASIGKKSITFTGNSSQLVHFNGSNQSPEAPTISDGLTISSVEITNSLGQTVTEAVDAGEYTFTYKVNETANTFAGTYSITFVIDEGVVPEFSAPIAKNDLVYNGEPQQLVTAGNVVNNGTMHYSINGVDFQTTIPTATNAGDYTIYYKVVSDGTEGIVDSATYQLGVSIAKKDVSFEGATAQSSIYTGSALSPQAPTVIDGLTINEVIIQNSAGNLLSESKEIGTYKYTYIVEESENHTRGEYVVNFNITHPLDIEYVAPTAIDGITYSGSAQQLIIPGTTDNGTFYYSLDGSNFTTDIPKAINAGAYAVYYKIKGNAGYKDVDIQSLNVTILKKNISINYVAVQNVEYSGQEITPNFSYSTEFTANLISISDFNSVKVDSAVNIGTYTFQYEVNGGTNYNPIVVTIVLNVNTSVQYVADNFILNINNPTEDQIKGEFGFYTNAKRALLELPSNKVSSFASNSAYEEAYAVYMAWAEIVGDSKPLESNYDYLNTPSGGCGGSIVGFVSAPFACIAIVSILSVLKRKEEK